MSNVRNGMRIVTATSLIALTASPFAIEIASGTPIMHPSSVIIERNGTQPSASGPTQNFTGSVRIDPLLLQPNTPSRITAASVTFEPSARSAWHSHPLGQMLIVTSGTGWVQQEGGIKQEIKPGDVVWTPPGVKHWHGATNTVAMTHIAVQESLNGRNVEWREKVGDDQYLAQSAQ
jgi:quercetin dioxygenase-like cupin family protein